MTHCSRCGIGLGSRGQLPCPFIWNICLLLLPLLTRIAPLAHSCCAQPATFLFLALYGKSQILETLLYL